MSATILRDEWLRALEEADMGISDDPTATTTAEFAAMFGIKRLAAERRLVALVAAGKATRTHKWSRGADGRRIRLVAYRLTKADKKKAA